MGQAVSCVTAFWLSYSIPWFFLQLYWRSPPLSLVRKPALWCAGDPIPTAFLTPRMDCSPQWPQGRSTPSPSVLMARWCVGATTIKGNATRRLGRLLRSLEVVPTPSLDDPMAPSRAGGEHQWPMQSSECDLRADCCGEMAFTWFARQWGGSLLGQQQLWAMRCAVWSIC